MPSRYGSRCQQSERHAAPEWTIPVSDVETVGMPIFPCPTTWPAAEADLIPFYLRPEHACALESDHVRLGRALPHSCHCGAELEVRDR